MSEEPGRPQPSEEDVRAVLREHGLEPGKRGKLAGKWWDEYWRIQQGDPGSVTAAAVPDTAEQLPGDADDLAAAETTAAAAAGMTEQRPNVRPRGRGRASSSSSSRGKGKRAGLQDRIRAWAGARPKKRRPRVPIDRFAERVWDGLARLAKSVDPPVATCLSLQAPVAGLVLEDIIRDTIADRAMQPFVRAEEKGRKAMALAGPPLLVAALEHAQTLPDKQRQAREALLIPMLTEALVIWVEVAGDKVEEKRLRDEEMGPVYEQVSKIMAAIFAPPTGGPGTPPPSPEDAAAAAAQAHAEHMAGV